jgi:hypothetical protein
VPIFASAFSGANSSMLEGSQIIAELAPRVSCRSFGLGPDLGDEETNRPRIGKILHVGGDGLPFGRSERLLH